MIKLSLSMGILALSASYEKLIVFTFPGLSASYENLIVFTFSPFLIKVDCLLRISCYACV